MSHDGNRVGVEVKVSLSSKKRRIIRGSKNECLRLLVISRYHIYAGTFAVRSSLYSGRFAVARNQLED